MALTLRPTTGCTAAEPTDLAPTSSTICCFDVEPYERCSPQLDDDLALGACGPPATRSPRRPAPADRPPARARTPCPTPAAAPVRPTAPAGSRDGSASMRPSRRRRASTLLSSSRLTLTVGISPPVKPTTSSRPPGASDRSESVKPVAADRVDDDVHAATVGQLLDRVLEPVGQHHVGGARRLGDRDLVLGADHRDRAARPERRREPAASTVPIPPAAPCTSTVSPSRQPAARAQREVHRQIVEQQAGASLERHRVRQLEHPIPVAAQRLRPSRRTASSGRRPGRPPRRAHPAGALRTTPAISAPGM